VILAWSDVLSATHSSKRAHNMVLHEFAHQLDTRNSRSADGVPLIESSQEADE
jgi:Mlc titration factor MtfA (ptsG expression regulator)